MCWDIFGVSSQAKQVTLFSCSTSFMSGSDKWDNYHLDALENGVIPPWESDEPFSFLVELVASGSEVMVAASTCIELGCGCSASAVYLAAQGIKCTAVDVSDVAIKRARGKYPECGVQWIQGDILHQDFLSTMSTFDFLFDMQCFHVLRSADERRVVQVICSLLNPGGHAVVVTGAVSEDEPALNPGPPVLLKSELLDPFINAGLECVSICQSRFNDTPDYSRRAPQPPLCWVAVFKKQESNSFSDSA
jgi:SAM-dependent methyltransferase